MVGASASLRGAFLSTASGSIQFYIVMASLFSSFETVGASASLRGASLSTASGSIHDLVHSPYFQVAVFLALVSATVLGTVIVTVGRSNSGSRPKRFRLKNEQKDVLKKEMQSIEIPKNELGKIDGEKFCGLVRNLPVLQSLAGPMYKLLTNDWLQNFAIDKKVFLKEKLARKKNTHLSKDDMAIFTKCVEEDRDFPERLQQFVTPDRLCRVRKKIALIKAKDDALRLEAQANSSKARQRGQDGGGRGRQGRGRSGRGRDSAKRSRNTNGKNEQATVPRDTVKRAKTRGDMHEKVTTTKRARKERTTKPKKKKTRYVPENIVGKAKPPTTKVTGKEGGEELCSGSCLFCSSCISRLRHAHAFHAAFLRRRYMRVRDAFVHRSCTKITKI